MMTRTLVKLIAITLAVLFASTAVDKLEYYALFSSQLQHFPFSIRELYKQAWIIPIAELIIAVSLLLRATRVKGLFVSLIVLSSYALYLTGMLESRFYCICHCGEPFQSLTLRMHIVFTLVCLLFTGVGVVLSARATESSSFAQPERFPFEQPYHEQIDTSLIKSKN